jgi:hypothetical protein
LRGRFQLGVRGRTCSPYYHSQQHEHDIHHFLLIIKIITTLHSKLPLIRTVGFKQANAKIENQSYS